MSQKLSLETLKLDIARREHIFIEVSHPEHLMAGTLTAQCKNNHIFTVNVRFYRSCRENRLGVKNGCPDCKNAKWLNLDSPRCRPKHYCTP